MLQSLCAIYIVHSWNKKSDIFRRDTKTSISRESKRRKGKELSVVSRGTTSLFPRGKERCTKQKLLALVAFPAHRRCPARVAGQFGNWNVTVRRIYSRASGVSLIKHPWQWFRADLISFHVWRVSLILDSLIAGCNNSSVYAGSNLVMLKSRSDWSCLLFLLSDFLIKDAVAA